MPLETVSRTSFTFRSDIPSSNRTEHKCGILHTLKHAYAHHDREEHAFAWLDDKTHENVELMVISQLVQFGFNEKKMLFIPFSSKDNWLHRYPHACPYMECDDEGVIKGMPCFQQCINNGSNAASIQTASTNTTSSRPTKKRKRSKSNTSKLIQSATLFDTERSQLHIEIYNYISWLYIQILQLEKMEGGRAHIRRAGILVPGVQNLMTKLESTFKNVREFKTREDEMKRNKDGEEAADDGDSNHEENGNTKNNNEGETASSDSEKKNAAPPTTPMPLLEECLELDLRRITDLRRVVEETQKNNDTAQEPVSYESEKYDFEIMFERLLAYKQQKGHFDIGYHYKDGACGLGQWVNKIRRRKKDLRARELECEPPDGNSDFVSLPISPGKLGLTLQFYKSSVGAVITSIDSACTFKDQIEVGDRLVTIDGEVVSKVEDLSQGNDENVRMFGIAKKKPYYNTYLSLERVERLESIGFIWVGTFVKEKRPWDEWLSLLKQYKETHGKWPSRNEKWENLGEWIHMQRRNYVRKDKNFMANRAPKLDEIGFPFVMRRFSQSVSWEDNVQKLAEFHRVNRHFNVPRPEGGSGDNDKEGLDFYKWAVTLRTWYRAYQEGNGKYTRLNEDRIIELIELGFEFEDGSAPTKKASVPDIAFEKRVEQLQKFYDEIGHMNIDYRYKYWDNFGGWAAEISKQYKDWQEGNETISPLVEHQFNELRALGFEFNVSPKFSKRSWQENFDVFLLYKQVHGHTQVPHKYKADVRLAKWVSIQRLEYKLVCEGKASKLTQERHDKLENAGFLWDAKTRKSTD